MVVGPGDTGPVFVENNYYRIVGDGDGQISTAIYPVGIRMDGLDATYGFGGDRPASIRNYYMSGVFRCVPWIDAADRDMPWNEIKSHFDVVVTPNSGCPALTPDNCVWNALCETPFVIGSCNFFYASGFM